MRGDDEDSSPSASQIKDLLVTGEMEIVKEPAPHHELATAGGMQVETAKENDRGDPDDWPR